MGRQLEFYLHPDDLPPIEQQLREHQAVFLGARSNTDALGEIDSLCLEGHLVFDAGITSKALAPQVTRTFIPQQSHWTLDYLRQPLVQFNGGVWEDGTVTRGRVWFQTAAGRGAAMPWEEEFVSFAETVRRIFRRNLVRIDHDGYRDWVGRHVRDLHNQGAVTLGGI